MIARRAFLAAALALGVPRIASAQVDFSDTEMRAFARATLDLQALNSQDAAAMTHVIQASGMSVEQYNRMGDAMRGDTDLAHRLNPYLDAERDARVGRARAATTYDPNRPYDPGSPRRAASSSRRRTTSKKRTSKSRRRSTAKSRRKTTTRKSTRKKTVAKKKKKS